VKKMVNKVTIFLIIGIVCVAGVFLWMNSQNNYGGKAEEPNNGGGKAEEPNNGGKAVAPEWPPNLEIVFTSDDGTKASIPTVQTMTQWFYFDEEGNQKGVLADSPPPNQIIYTDDVTLDLNGSGGEAVMLFSDENFIPDTISIYRLDVTYLYENQMDLYNDHNTAQENADKNQEPVLLDGKRFLIENDGLDYIYIINAKWDAKGLISSESNTTYCFRVNS